MSGAYYPEGYAGNPFTGQNSPYGQYSGGTTLNYNNDSDVGYKEGSYPEVDEDSPYSPAKINQTAYRAEQNAYNAWINSKAAELERDGGMGAQAMRGALNQSQLAMQAQANARGANASSERAALYAGGQLQRSGAIDASRLTAQESQAMQQMQNDAMQKQMQQELAWQALEMQRQQMMSQNYNAAMTGDIQQTQNDWSNGTGIVGSVIGAAAMSDVRVKDNVRAADRESADQTMRGLDLYEYNYRPEYVDRAAQIAGIPPEIKQGRQTGVMAQDLERTPLGKDMVYQDPGTGRLAIDGSQAVTTSLGLIGRLGERADDLEQRLAELEQQRAATARGGRRGA